MVFSRRLQPVRCPHFLKAAGSHCSKRDWASSAEGLTAEAWERFDECFLVWWGREVTGALRGPQRLKLQNRKWLEHVLWALSGGLQFRGVRRCAHRKGLMVPQNLKLSTGYWHHDEAMMQIHKGQTALLGYRRCSLARKGQVLALTGRCVNPNPSDL